MIVALLNQKGGVGKTTLALHLAGEWSREGKRVTLILNPAVSAPSTGPVGQAPQPVAVSQAELKQGGGWSCRPCR